MPRPSQKLIAKKLGISTAAVSLALRDKGTVSKELTSKVKAMAESLGYRPNPVLASLASKRFRNASGGSGVPIALIDFLSGRMGNGSLYTKILKQRADDLGYHLNIIPASELAHYHAPAKTLYNRGVQGLVILGPVADSVFRSDFDWSAFSVVLCGRYLEPLPFDTVRPNIFQSIKLAYHKARDCGYKRIGFALGHHLPLLEDDESRISAALGFQRIEEPFGESIPPYFGQIHDRPKLVDWAKQHRPDCVIGFHVGQAWDLMAGGFRIPHETAFVALHLSASRTIGENHKLLVSGNDQNMSEIAIQSMNLLDQKIKHHEFGMPDLPKHVLVPSTWMDGDTLPDISGNARIDNLRASQPTANQPQLTRLS